MSIPSEPVVFTADLADLLGSPHHSFTRLELQEMTEQAKVLILKDQADHPIGVATVKEDPVTGHFLLHGTIGAQIAQEVREGIVLGFSCDSPLHGSSGRQEDTGM